MFFLKICNWVRCKPPTPWNGGGGGRSESLPPLRFHSDFCRWDPESETGSHREGLL
jgi:hypothetical protein